MEPAATQLTAHHPHHQTTGRTLQRSDSRDCINVFMMNLMEPGPSKLFNRRKRTNNLRNCLNDHLFLNNRDINQILRRHTCSTSFVMDMVVHRPSKLFNRRKRTHKLRNCLNDHLFRNNREFHNILRHLTCSKMLLKDFVIHGHSKLFNRRKRINDTRRNRLHCSAGEMRGRGCTPPRGMMERSRQLHLGMPENKPTKGTKTSVVVAKRYPHW